MGQDILIAKHVQKEYGRKVVLADISFTIKKGDIYGLIGKNGSGKTTLFRILSGLIPQHGGTVLREKGSAYDSKMSVVMGTPSLYLTMSAVQNMKTQAYLLGSKNDSDIAEILRTVGLADCGRKAARDFSLGMLQRLKIGMALLGEPDLLILDEPSNGLDPDGIVSLRELLLELNRSRGVTLLLSSHILHELEQIATRIGILHKGKIVKEISLSGTHRDEGSLEEIYIRHTSGT